jgi:hypothetical protein
MKTFLISLGVVLTLAIVTVIWAVGISNSEKKLKFRGEAQQAVCEAFFSNMWEILQTKAGVATEYKDAFTEIYPQLIEGRYSQGDGSLMKWITESNPNFDTSLYKDLMVAIESQRNGFFIEQSKLIDIDREHKTMRAVFPANLVIGKRQNIGYKVDPETGKITEGIIVLKNLATQDAYATGVDSSPDLFGKDKK